MKGCKPAEYRLRAVERRSLSEIVKEGRQLQRVARRAPMLLALDRGERSVEIMRWLGVSRMGVWHVWQRYQHRGVAAILDEERKSLAVWRHRGFWLLTPFLSRWMRMCRFFRSILSSVSSVASSTRKP